jgi:tetratricopeptide (TPR) repeat protein
LVFEPTDDLVVRFKKVIQELLQVEGKNLLVIDNAANVAAQYLDELSKLTNWKILLTSRDAIPNMAHIELKPLSDEDAARLFRRIYQKEVDKTELTDILRGLTNHTLAIELVAAYAREKNITIIQLKEELRVRGLQNLDNYHVTSTKDSDGKTVIAHLLQTFVMELGDDEKEIMRYFSVLPPDGADFDIDLMSEEQLAISFQKEEDKANLHNTLRVLTRLNWLKKQGNSYLCHPVIKEIVHIQLKPDTINCEKLIESFNRFLYIDESSIDHNHIINLKRFEPFAAEIFKGCFDEQTKPDSTYKNLIGLTDKLRRVHSAIGNLYLSLKYSQINFFLSKEIFGEQHLEIVPSISNLSSTYQSLGDLSNAKIEILKAIKIKEALVDTKDLNLSSLYNNLAIIYQDLGDSPKAKIEILKAIKISEALLEPKDLRLAVPYSNLAMIYRDLNDLKNAQIQMHKSIDIQKAQLNPMDIRLAASYSNLSTIYLSLGNLPKAKEGIINAIEIQEALLDPENLELAIFYTNLSAMCQKLGDLVGAQKEILKAIKIREIKLDPQHIDLAQCYNNYSHILKDMNETREAKLYMDKAVEIRKLKLPQRHKHLLNSLKMQQFLADKLSGNKKTIPKKRKF